jgi:hypothetical protein
MSFSNQIRVFAGDNEDCDDWLELLHNAENRGA